MVKRQANIKYKKYYLLYMTKISLDIPDTMYAKIKKKATDETVKKGKFVGMNDLIIPLLEKEFGT